MTIAHHPGLESLMSCSAGSMPEAFAAIMASHICVCPECRKELALMDDIGVQLFRSMKPAALTRQAPVAALRRSEADSDLSAGRTRQPAEGFQPPAAGGVPAPLVPLVGDDLDTIAWEHLAPGVQHYPLPLTPGAKARLHLLKVSPGAMLPEHEHAGSELTLVLRGSYSDASGRYAAGDVADMEPGTQHAPVADANEGCVCLIASEDKIRF